LLLFLVTTTNSILAGYLPKKPEYRQVNTRKSMQGYKLT